MSEMTKLITDTSAKVTIPVQYHHYYELLKKVGFGNRDILVMSAFLGFKKGARKETEKPEDVVATKKIEIRGEYLGDEDVWLYLILNDATNDALFKNFNEESEKIGYLTNGPLLEYANAGIELIGKSVLDQYIAEDGSLRIETIGLQTELLHYLWDELKSVPF